MTNEPDAITDGLNLLTVPPARSGEKVRVVSGNESLGARAEIDAYVDEDGVVRQEENGACFNADAYEVKR